MAGSSKKSAAGKRKSEETTEPARASKKRNSERRKSDAAEAPKALKDAEWTAALGELRIELLPMDAVPFLGSVQLRVVQGSLQLLGSTVGAGSEWHELHSPAGGLPIVLQTASAVSRPAVIVLRRINRGVGASLSDAAASDAPRTSTAEAEAEAAVAAEAVEAVEAVDEPAVEAGTEAMVEGESRADPSPLNVGVHARTPMRPDLPQLVSAALSAVTPGDVTEATPRAPAAPATPAVGGAVSASSARAPPPPPLGALGALNPLGPVWGGASAHEPRAARALDLMTRYLTLRPLPAPAEVGLRGWMPDEWEEAADELVESMWGGKGGKGGAEPRAPRLLLCGGRNVGKSSFARFLVNRALSAAPGGAPVCFLDTDVGQSELSAPGLVSLHVLGAPLLGPPHTHVRPAAVSCCVGDASPGADPHHFLRCVGFVLEAYRRDYAGHPLIINTCGYATGLGAQLLADVLQAACPTVVVHLDKPPPARAGREQEPSELAALVDACGVRVMPLPPLQLASLLAPSSDYRPGPLLPSAPSAADLRTLQLLAYFGALPPATHALPGGAEGFLEAAWQVRIRVRVGVASPNPHPHPHPNPNELTLTLMN